MDVKRALLWMAIWVAAAAMEALIGALEVLEPVVETLICRYEELPGRN